MSASTLTKLTLALLLLVPAAWADGQFGQTFSATGSSSGIPQANTGITQHKLTWVVTGAPASCTVALDSSTDGVSWSAGGSITGQTCTSNGSSAITASTVNFVRITVTALSAAATVNVTWTGYLNNPVVPNFPLLAPNGSAGAPSYANTVGTTGMHFSAGPTINFDIAGNTQMQVSASGSVVSIPNYSLTIGTGSVNSASYFTQANCASTGGTCGSAPTGSVGITNPATTVTVSTTAVTANSTIFIQEDATLGTKLSATCNSTTGRTYMVTTRTAGTSFIITASATPAANTACLNYWIVN